MTIATIITDVRMIVEDSGSTRYTDAQLLPWVKKAIRRANHVIRKYKLGMGIAKQAYSITPTNYADLALPTDFLSVENDAALWRTDTAKALLMKTPQEWESKKTGSEEGLSMWKLDEVARTFDIREAPSTGAATVTVNLWYIKKIDPSAYTTSSASPWNGDLDDLIAEYVATRALNADEYEIGSDAGLWKEFESAIIDTFLSNRQVRHRSAGWNL